MQSDTTPGLQSARTVITDLLRDVVEGNNPEQSVMAADLWLEQLERVMPYQPLEVYDRHADNGVVQLPLRS